MPSGKVHPVLSKEDTLYTCAGTVSLSLSLHSSDKGESFVLLKNFMEPVNKNVFKRGISL